MEKYKFDDSLKLISKFRFKLNKGMPLFGNIFLKNSSKCLKRDKNITLKKEVLEFEKKKLIVYIIIPKEVKALNPCLFYIHGGGFTFEIQPHQFKNAAFYATHANSVVVLPCYSLTPKSFAPKLFNECKFVLDRLSKNYSKYNIDRNCIGIGGDSAGGFLAANLVNYAIENNGQLAYQLLIYPVIDNKMRTESMKKYKDTPLWNAKNNEVMWKWYYKNKTDEISLLDKKLDIKLPPTYVEVAEFDCLHDEGLLYAEKIKALNIDVKINDTIGTMHGYDCVKSTVAEEALNERINFIKKYLKNF